MSMPITYLRQVNMYIGEQYLKFSFKYYINILSVTVEYKAYFKIIVLLSSDKAIKKDGDNIRLHNHYNLFN